MHMVRLTRIIAFLSSIVTVSTVLSLIVAYSIISQTGS
jgi:hypothetical protein